MLAGLVDVAAAPPGDAAGADAGTTNRNQRAKPIQCTDRLTPNKRIGPGSRTCDTQPLHSRASQSRAGRPYTTAGGAKVGIW